jgi:signal transduction histidine kinase
MKLYIENRIRAGYIVVFFLLGLSYLSFFIANNQLTKQTVEMKHNNQIINKLEFLLSYVKDAETGVRGFIAVKDIRFLDVYDSSFRQLKPVFVELKDLMKNNQVELSRLETLKARINEKYKLLNEGVEIFKSNGLQMTDSLKTIAYHGKEIMDTIRSMVKTMEVHENSLLEERSKKMEDVLNALNIIILSSIVIAVVLAVYSIFIYNRENRDKKIAAANATTYRNELEKRVEQLNKANLELKELKSIEKFAASGRIARQMAHEIRNPLTNIGLACEQLRTDANNDNGVIFFDIIDRNAKRINQLVSDLLNSTRFTQLQVEDININVLINEVLENANDRLELKSIQLQKNFGDGIPKVSVDKERMKIALLNIIVNAIEAMDAEKGILTITTSAINNKCCIKITDNGKGISKEELGKIFEPYFTGKSKGTGLGLTSTQNIIFNHQGTIDVESEEGKGSTFIITLNFAGTN